MKQHPGLTLAIGVLLIGWTILSTLLAIVGIVARDEGWMIYAGSAIISFLTAVYLIARFGGSDDEA